MQQENNVALSPDEPPEERIALEEPAGVLFLEREQLTSGGPDQGQAVLDTPHLGRKKLDVFTNLNIDPKC